MRWERLSCQPVCPTPKYYHYSKTKQADFNNLKTASLPQQNKKNPPKMCLTSRFLVMSSFFCSGVREAGSALKESRTEGVAMTVLGRLTKALEDRRVQSLRNVPQIRRYVICGVTRGQQHHPVCACVRLLGGCLLYTLGHKGYLLINQDVSEPCNEGAQTLP